MPMVKLLRESEAYSLGQLDKNLGNPRKSAEDFNRKFSGSYSYYVKGYEASPVIAPDCGENLSARGLSI